jgi:hypothetical protein
MVIFRIIPLDLLCECDVIHAFCDQAGHIHAYAAPLTWPGPAMNDIPRSLQGQVIELQRAAWQLAGNCWWNLMLERQIRFAGTSCPYHTNTMDWVQWGWQQAGEILILFYRCQKVPYVPGT